MMRWKRSSGVPRAWATAALMGSACETATTICPGCRATIRPSTGGHAGLHLRDRLAAREAEGAGAALHRLPLRPPGRLLQAHAGPLADVEVGQVAI